MATKIIPSLKKAFEWKVHTLLTLGVVLMLGSMYINTIKAGAGDYGIYVSLAFFAVVLIIELLNTMTGVYNR